MAVVPVPTQGIPSFVYELGQHGKDLLADKLDPTAIKGVDDTGPRFIHHTHLLNEFIITLSEAACNSGLSVGNWRHEYALKTWLGQPPRVQIRHPALGSGIVQASYLPDGFCTITAPSRPPLLYFVEIDRGTHSQRKWIERSLVFSRYANQRDGWLHQALQRNFRLLIITLRPPRCRNILQSIRKAGANADGQLFLLASAEELLRVGRNANEQDILAPVWRRVDTEEPVGLLPEDARIGTVRVRAEQSEQMPRGATRS